MTTAKNRLIIRYVYMELDTFRCRMQMRVVVILTTSWLIGFSFGIGLTYPLCGVLIAHYGWRSVFYTTGSLGIIWCLVWWLLAFDTPAKHPRITKKELDYIECTRGESVIGRKVRVFFSYRVFRLLIDWTTISSRQI